jgi:hypothetical protein
LQGQAGHDRHLLFQHAANYTGRKARAMPPVYPAERVARAIVNVIGPPAVRGHRWPDWADLFMQWKLAPGLTERQMAVQVDKLHLLRAQAAPPTAGNLFDPAPGPGSVDGGWHGRRRTAFRRAASAALVGAGVVAAARQRR